MTKAEIISSIEIFLSLHSQDKRLISSFKKEIDTLFSDYSSDVPFNSLSVQELKSKKAILVKSLSNSLLSDTAKASVKKVIDKIEKRIEDLS